MGLLQSLNLVPPGNRDTAAKPAALRRARLAARLRKGGQREVLQAAIDTASRSGSNTAEDLDDFVYDEDNMSDPVSKMAPRTAYEEGKEGRGEDKGLAGRLTAQTEASVTDSHDPSAKTEVAVSTSVEKREIWEKRIGDGDRIYKRDKDMRGLRKPDGFKSPEKLVLGHEHLHLVIRAHVSARVQEFGNTAFGAFEFDRREAQQLKLLLDTIIDETRKSVSEWLDQVGVPDHPGEIRRAEKLTERLLKDGTIERQVRTALLKVVRKNARELAKFRKA